ncbi:MAG: HAMP domain-containing histidine kinase, partial [Actinobacteria bacterium]|nr:HAMP domain-containing histidine kinase [Actinomycetota bacterium]
MFRWLRLRLAASHAIVLVVILLVLGTLVQFLLSRSLDRSATNQLLQQATDQAERLDENGAAAPPADVDAPSAAAVKVAVFRSPGDVPMGEPSEIPSWLRHYPAKVTDLNVSGERVRVVSVPAIVNGTTIAWVVAGRSLLPEERLVDRVRLLLLFGGGVAALASLAGGWWLAGRAVRPVERAYEAQAGFAADASHELRTPLAFIRSGVEVLSEHDSALGAEVLSEVDYLAGLSERLLRLARAERGQMTLERAPVRVAEVCRSAARRSQAAHATLLAVGGDDEIVGAAG